MTSRASNKPKKKKAGRWIVCYRCGHGWKSRVAQPIQCPKCMNRYYDRPRKGEGGCQPV